MVEFLFRSVSLIQISTLQRVLLFFLLIPSPQFPPDSIWRAKAAQLRVFWGPAWHSSEVQRPALAGVLSSFFPKLHPAFRFPALSSASPLSPPPPSVCLGASPRQVKPSRSRPHPLEFPCQPHPAADGKRAPSQTLRGPFAADCASRDPAPQRHTLSETPFGISSISLFPRGLDVERHL